MYHLDNNSGVVTRPDIPAVQSSQPRWFTEGGNGTPPSYPGAHWFNTVQAEMLGILSAASITPQKHQLNQITLAIQALIGNQIRNHTHTINQVTGLSEALQGLSTSKAPLVHRHEIAEINGLSAKLNEIDGKQAALVRHEINLSGLNHNKYYLVVFNPSAESLDGRRWRFNVLRKLNGNHKPSWATHGNGFALQLGWQSNASVWGENHVYRVIDNYDYTWTEQPPVINIGQMLEASMEYCYLRGGTSYQVEAMAGFSVQLKSQGLSLHGVTLNGVMDFAQNLVPQVTLKVASDKAMEAATTLRDVSDDLQDFGNLCLDPTMLNPKFGFSWGAIGYSERLGDQDVKVITGRDSFYRRPLNVKAGDRFYLSCRYRRKKGTADLGIGLYVDRDKPSADFILGKTTQQGLYTLSNSILISAGTYHESARGWSRLEGYVDIPSGVSSAEIWLNIDHPHGVDTTQYYIKDVEWRRVPGKLVAQSDFSYQRIGNFVVRKYPDGTMIQTYRYEITDLADWSEKEFTWAVAFADKPIILPHITTSWAGQLDCGINVLTKSDNARVYYHYYEHGSINQGQCRVEFVGVGHWKQ